MNELLVLSAHEAAQRIQDKEISSRELTSLLLDHIEEANPTVNAVTEVSRELAMAQAVAADNSPASGPLHGVPMTIKDGFHATGFHTTWGNPAYKDYVAQWDSTIVHRFKQAGAVIVGKSNVAFMMGDFGQSTNELFGTVNNPANPAYSAGGSSGGAAAALAANMTFLEYGSDLAGSIRIPASFCGVYGLKPSGGIVPATGFQPPGPPPIPSDMPTVASIGPLARTAGDLRLALTVTAGPENVPALTWHLPPPRHKRLKEFRVGVVYSHPQAPPSDEITGLMSNALMAAGVSIVEGWPAGVDPMRSYESFGFQVELFFAMHEPDASGPDFATFVEQDRQRLAMRAAWADYFRDIDVFICPANFTAAFPHDHRPMEQITVNGRSYMDQSFWIAHASLAGLPAVAAPIGLTAAGLPAGIQVIGPPYEDDTALTFAELLAGVLR